MTEHLTIPMTDRPPIRIVKDNWPLISRADWYDSPIECQANREAHLRVRRHADGRTIIYGYSSSQFQTERGCHSGELLDANIDPCCAIRSCATYIDHEFLADECIAGLPSQDIL